MRAARTDAFDPEHSRSVVSVAAGTGVLLSGELGEQGRSLEHDPFLSFVSEHLCSTFPETFQMAKGRGPVSSSDVF